MQFSLLVLDIAIPTASGVAGGVGTPGLVLKPRSSKGLNLIVMLEGRETTIGTSVRRLRRQPASPGDADPNIL